MSTTFLKRAVLFELLVQLYKFSRGKPSDVAAIVKAARERPKLEKAIHDIGCTSYLKFARLLSRLAKSNSISEFNVVRSRDRARKVWRYSCLATAEKLNRPAKPARTVVAMDMIAAPAMDDTERAIDRLSRGEQLRKTIESAPKPAAPVVSPPVVAPPPVDPAPCDVWTGPHGTAEEAESARSRISKHSGRPAVVVVIAEQHYAHSVGCVDSLAVADAVRRINVDLRETARVGLYGTVPSRNALIQQSISNAREWQEIRAMANPPQVIGKRG